MLEFIKALSRRCRGSAELVAWIYSLYFGWSTVRPFHPQFETSQLLVCCTSTGIDTSAFPAIAWASNLCFKCPSWHPSKTVRMFKFQSRVRIKTSVFVGCMLCSTNGRWKLEVWVSSCIHLNFWAQPFLRLSPMQALFPSSSICAASRRVSCDGDARSTKAWWFFYTSGFFPFCAKHLIARKKKQACLKKPSAFGDFLKIRSPQRSSIIKLEKMGKEPFWRKLPFLRMTKYGRKSWCRNSCDTIDIAYVLDICHRSPFILVLSLGPPKSSYLTHPSILLASTCFALL